jgi:hypothetical protein
MKRCSEFSLSLIRRITNMTVARKITCRALELADEGLISYRTLAECALKWMSEDDVAEMLKANEIYVEDSEDDDN